MCISCNTVVMEMTRREMAAGANGPLGAPSCSLDDAGAHKQRDERWFLLLYSYVWGSSPARHVSEAQTNTEFHQMIIQWRFSIGQLFRWSHPNGAEAK